MSAHNGEPTTNKSSWAKPLLGLLLVGAVVIAWTSYGDSITLENLAQEESRLREWKSQNLPLVLAVAFGLYVVVTGLALPVAVVLSLTYAWYFGFWTALPLVSFASTLGATLSFLSSRYLLRDAVHQRFGQQLAGLNASLEREGPFFLFTLRLIPAVPFFLVNVLMGLTPITTKKFWWISQLGMLPGTAAYLFAGASVPSLSDLAEQGTAGIITPQILVAFVLLAAFPFVARWVISAVQHGDYTADSKGTHFGKVD